MQRTERQAQLLLLLQVLVLQLTPPLLLLWRLLFVKLLQFLPPGLPSVALMELPSSLLVACFVLVLWLLLQKWW